MSLPLVRALGAVNFAVLILLHTSDELGCCCNRGSTGSRIGSSHGYTVWYTFCMPFVLAPDSLVMYVFYIPFVWYCNCALPS